MDEMNDFGKQLAAIKRRYEEQQKKVEAFNIFSALFKEKSDEELHSRFISYLLSPESKHGMKSQFLALFVRDVLKLKDDFQVDDSCKVYPNEENKKEQYNIDILIFSNDRTKAIIVENKISANDSNDDIEKNTHPDYDGQLERYYHTIKGKDKYGYDVKIDGCPIKCESVKVFYLTMYKFQPSLESHKSILPEDFSLERSIIRYHEIHQWLSSCIKITNDTIVKNTIEHYLNFLIKITNDDKIPLSLISLINEHPDYWRKAYNELDNRDNSEFMENNRKHIAWHITHRFFNELKKVLEGNSYKIHDSPNNEKITRATHENKKEIKDSLVVCFEKVGDENKFYIANDLNGMTYGKIGGEYRTFPTEIKFHDFKIEETFKLVYEVERKTVIDKLVGQISEFVTNKITYYDTCIKSNMQSDS